MKNILIVENDDIWLELLTMILQKEGFNCISTSSLESACKLLSEQVFDLVLTDMRLTDDNNRDDQGGLELVAYISKSTSRPSVILQTGYTTLEIAKRLFLFGKEFGLKVHIVGKEEGPRPLIDICKKLLNTHIE